MDKEKGEETLVRPAVEGTKRVLETCLKVPSVKKVIVTSSTAAVWDGIKWDNTDTVNEEQWSNEAALVENRDWYSLSKYRAEKLAWSIAKREGVTFELVTVCCVVLLVWLM